MCAIRCLVLAVAAGVALPSFAETKPNEKALAEPSHEKLAEVSIKGSGGLTLQTLCADKDGRVLALVAQSRYYNGPAEGVTSEVHVYTGEGKKALDWKVAFHAHSINVGPDGTIFVAGSGKVARFDKAGKALGEIELPHIAELVKNKDKLKADAEIQLKQQRESFERTLKSFTQQKEALEKKKPEELTDLEKKQLEQFKSILKSYEQTLDYYAKKTVDEVVAETLSRLKVINGIAVSEKDLFLVCGESKGYGYAIWRMTHDFKDPKQVKGAVGGCCGQMDIQVSGSDFLLAENTAYKFGRYDRDGKPIGAWGKGMMAAPGKEAPPECFGGCCNPMNLRVDKSGDVYTAESEGVIKRFSAKGDFLGTVGKVALTGGCKNVAVAVTQDADRVFFCDQPGSKVIILAKKKAEKPSGGN
jgi:hypothetical protein